MRIGPRLGTASIAAALLVVCASAHAQSVSPMRGVIGSVADRFLVRLSVSNPGTTDLVGIVKAYDAEFRPIPIAATVRRMDMPPGFARLVTVAVPFEGRADRKVRLCIESAPPSAKGGVLVKSRICGRYLGRRIGGNGLASNR